MALKVKMAFSASSQSAEHVDKLKQCFSTTKKYLDCKVAKTPTFWRQICQKYLETLKLKAAAAIDCVGLLHDFSIAILSVQNVNHSGNYSSSMNFDEKYLWSVWFEMSWNSDQLQKAAPKSCFKRLCWDYSLLCVCECVMFCQNLDFD